MPTSFILHKLFKCYYLLFCIVIVGISIYKTPQWVCAQERYGPYSAPGQIYLKHECSSNQLSKSQMREVRSQTNTLAFSGGLAHPNRAVERTSKFKGTAHCPGLTFDNAYAPSDELNDDLELWMRKLCFKCLQYIRSRMHIEFCMDVDWGRYASTECVITYHFYRVETDDDYCPALWPGELYRTPSTRNK